MSYKKLIFSALPALALIATLSVGCKKSNSSSNSSSISGTFGSTNFSASGGSSTAWYSTDSSVYILIGGAINGKDTSGLSLSIFPPFTLNTAITSTWAVNIDYFVSSTQDYYAGNGFGNVALTVTSQDTVNHKIGGTFTGTLYNAFNNNDSIKVTNGKFNTAYNVVP